MKAQQSKMSAEELKAYLAGTGTAGTSKTGTKKKPSTPKVETPSPDFVDDDEGTAGHIWTNPPALAIAQPRATLLAAGARRLETRNVPTGYRGLVYIYATALDVNRYTLAPLAYDTVMSRGLYGAANYGGVIVGEARLVRCSRIIPVGYEPEFAGRTVGLDDLLEDAAEAEGLSMTPGRYVWEFADAVLFRPVLYRKPGRPNLAGLWELDNATAEYLAEISDPGLD